MKTFQDLIELARILRAPGGCPWDQEQTLQTTKDYVIEEAFELIDAIEAGKIQDQVEEIGDLLFQIAFMIVLLEEEEPESVAMLIHKIYDKLIYRHPHVFDKQGDKNILSTKQVLQQWETLKNKEANKQQRKSSLDKIPLSYPSLMRAHQVLKIFNKKGFISF